MAKLKSSCQVAPSGPKWTGFSPPPLPQVAELLASVEDSVVNSIKKDYGSETGVTTLWNTTMDRVTSFFFL